MRIKMENRWGCCGGGGAFSPKEKPSVIGRENGFGMGKKVEF